MCNLGADQAMKYAISLLALVLLAASGTRAQDSQLPASALPSIGEAPAGSDMLKTFAFAAPASPEALADFPEAIPSASNSAASPRPEVQSVFPSYRFQAYGGYTFVRFNAFPGRHVSRNGFDISLSYFLKSGLFGVEGAVTGAFGSIGNENSGFALVGGGPRVRWAGPRGFQFWAHGLLGDAHFLPRVGNSGENAFAYELGGGIDIPAHFRRMAFRTEADMIGTRFYGTGQYSPKLSAGLVFKF